MALTDRETLMREGNSWYRNAALEAEAYHRFKARMEVIAGAAILAVPLLVVAIVYLSYWLWSRACGVK